MRKKGYKGRCEKKDLSKSQEVCRTYDAIQSNYADILQNDNDIQEIRCNVLLDGLSEGAYTSDFTEKYLSGGEVTVAYNPDDVSAVWLIDNGSYIRFDLIESRYKGKELSDVEIMQKGQKELVKAATADNIQAQINLAQSIEIIAASVNNPDKVNIKSIRNTRQREQTKNHIDYIRGIEA